MKKSNPEGTQTDGANQWMALLNLGWLIVGNMLLFVGGGLWLDKHFNTAPILLLIGVFLGFFGSGYTIYLAVKKLERDEAGKPHP
ncbi:MAG: putative F0F1-ATPase subunit Ca2+/Mg2+ transporter [Fibrobacteres bacterium]|nr:putative F0F1-ATPase subunit Ca2+/Mg2+ transporter [Fibrobacterota bacterium]